LMRYGDDALPSSAHPMTLLLPRHHRMLVVVVVIVIGFFQTLLL